MKKKIHLNTNYYYYHLLHMCSWLLWLMCNNKTNQMRQMKFYEYFMNPFAFTVSELLPNWLATSTVAFKWPLM